jgi:LemA protein
LIATVKGARDNERAILENVTRARSGMASAQSPAELQELGATVNKAISIVFENYPEIKSNENFAQLQAELSGSENRVSKARSDYNEAVEKSNGYIRGFWKKKALARLSIFPPPQAFVLRVHRRWVMRQLKLA